MMGDDSDEEFDQMVEDGRGTSDQPPKHKKRRVSYPPTKLPNTPYRHPSQVSPMMRPQNNESILLSDDVAWLDYIEANSSADGMEIEKSMEQHVYRLAGNQSDEEQMNPLNGPLNMFPASGTKSDFFGSL